MADKRLGKKLAQQKRFAALYIANRRNATRAYQIMFPRVQGNTASSNGSRMLKNAYVLEEVDRLTREAFKKEHMSAEEVLTQMARLSRSDIGDLTWKPGELDSAGNPTDTGRVKPLYEMPKEVRLCIKSLKWDERGRPEFSFWDKPSQLTNLGKHHKLLSETLNINVQHSFADRLKTARSKRLGGK